MAWLYPGTTGYGTGFSESLSRNAWCHFCSRHRMNSRKILLSCSVLSQSLILIASSSACIYSIVITGEVSLSHMDPCIVGNVIMIILMLASVMHVMRGILRENISEVACCIILILTHCLFSAINYRSHRDLLPAAVSLYASVVCTLVSTLLACLACCKFRCQRIVGAADSLRYMYGERTHLLVIMRMDLVFMITYSLVSFNLNHHGNYYGYYACCAVLMLAVLKWLMGRIAVMNEKKGLLYAYVCIMMLSHLWIPVHLLLVSCFRHSVQSCGRHEIEYSSISLIAAIAVIFDQIYIMINLLKVFRNFGYGLTDRGMSYVYFCFFF